MNKKLSFIMPSRNGLKYLKWSYNSIRKNLNKNHEILIYDDFSDDGTWGWLTHMITIDNNLKIFRNDGPTRLGHTILYDKLINNATNDIVMIWHNDMYAFPGLDEEIFKYIKPKTVVSLTRIEPSLHPPGPEKITLNWGIEPEEFDEYAALDWVNDIKKQYKDKTTEGIFAPWAIYKEDFLKVYGHDPLYAPQSKEDSDIFNKFELSGYKFIQTWNGFIYHMTCRGSRFNTKLTKPGVASDEWLIQNRKSERNFIRKWGSFVKHNKFMKPIVSNKYNIGLVIKNCTDEILTLLEPWVANIYVDCNYTNYINNEQSNTLYNLSERVKSINTEPNNDVIVKFDAKELTSDLINFLFLLPDVLNDSAIKDTTMRYSIFLFKINKLNVYQLDLLKLENNIKNSRIF